MEITPAMEEISEGLKDEGIAKSSRVGEAVRSNYKHRHAQLKKVGGVRKRSKWGPVLEKKHKDHK
jgi:hypothetical protein